MASSCWLFQLGKACLSDRTMLCCWAQQCAAVHAVWYQPCWDSLIMANDLSVI
jgi:hypothetical protein